MIALLGRGEHWIESAALTPQLPLTHIVWEDKSKKIEERPSPHHPPMLGVISSKLLHHSVSSPWEIWDVLADSRCAHFE